jgi:outer membrane lipoprotein carrier protein
VAGLGPLVALLGCLLAAPAAGDSAAAAGLAARLEALTSLSGDFEQTVTADDGAAARASAGHFSLLRPGFFRWEITAPDDQLLIAADGFLWHYDRDLETVTRRPLAAGAGSAPLRLLAGDSSTLDADFEVTRSAPERWLLRPRRADEAAFREVELAFADGLPAAMHIVDGLGQQIEIRFSALVPGRVRREDFAFTPPPGVDVYYQER